jgi:hypothetical protein
LKRAQMASATTTMTTMTIMSAVTAKWTPLEISVAAKPYRL